MGELQGSTESSISERIRAEMAQLSPVQLKYLAIRVQNPGISKSEAASQAGVSRDTVYRWPQVDDVFALIMLDTVAGAREMLVRSVARAMAVKLSGLNSKSEKLRQSVATELYEWVSGKAAQPVSVSGEIREFMQKLVGIDE